MHIFIKKARNNILSDTLILKKKRFIKFPNPPVLTDNINSTFNDWLKNIKNKLFINADYYKKELAQIAYVTFRIKKKVKLYLTVR